MRSIQWCCICLLMCLLGESLWAQTAFQPNFLDVQRSYSRPATALLSKEDTLRKQFEDRNLVWPANFIYIRSFKYDSKLEVWVKQERDAPFQLFKTYKVCALAGTMGPKRMEGDYQVPEGFYYINEFNPRSEYHLALGLNYPNASDRLLSDSIQPGGDIFIHGSCVTTGCIPILDNQIEELYIIAAHAKAKGQDFIPVHVFPVMFGTGKSNDYMEKFWRDNPELVSFHKQLRTVYQYFNQTRQIPVIAVNEKGQYVLDESVKQIAAKVEVKPQPKVIVKKDRTVKGFDEKTIPTAVNQLPVYPGGSAAFQTYIDQLGKSLEPFLLPEQSTTYVQVEYIITKEGKLIMPKVVKGGNDELNENLLDAFEKMPVWTPAKRNQGFEELAVPMRLRQTVVVTRSK